MKTGKQTEGQPQVATSAAFGIWVNAATQKPKVGKKVIVCGHWGNGNRWRALAAWQPAGTIDAHAWDDPPDDWWDDDECVCTNPTDEWMEESIEAEVVYPLSNVTHWMPLPDMPNDPAETREPITPNTTQSL